MHPAPVAGGVSSVADAGRVAMAVRRGTGRMPNADRGPSCEGPAARQAATGRGSGAGKGSSLLVPPKRPQWWIKMVCPPRSAQSKPQTSRAERRGTGLPWWLKTCVTVSNRHAGPRAGL